MAKGSRAGGVLELDQIPFALGDCQKGEKTLNFRNGCHFEIVNLVGVVVTVHVKLCDLIINDLEFCG
jgi:hypothetical protein